MEDKSLGQIAFEAYKQSVGGKTYDEKPISEWDQLSTEVKKGWNAAGNAIYGKATEELLKNIILSSGKRMGA